MSHKRITAITLGFSIVLTVGLARTAPASASVTCPSGSVGWHTENDANGNQIIMNAGNYGTGADTCFTYGADGAMTLTQADLTYSSSPTSYPNDGYGCDNSYCSTGWTSEPWASVTSQLTGGFSTSGVASGSEYDQILDSFFTTTASQPFTYPNAEIEIISFAAPSYSSLGFCVSTSCGATEYPISGSNWWLSEKTAHSASYTWPDYLFVQDIQGNGIADAPLETFYSTASNSGEGPSLGSLNLGFLGFGAELWKNGAGLSIGPVDVTNLP